MPIDKAVNLAPDSEDFLILGDMEDAPEIEIVIDEEGVEVDVGVPEEEKDFYANIAGDIDEQDLNRIALELMEFFEADKSSRSAWEEMYAKGLELLGLRMQERTQPFRGASGAVHPMLTEAIVQFQAQAFKELMPMAAS